MEFRHVTHASCDRQEMFSVQFLSDQKASILFTNQYVTVQKYGPNYKELTSRNCLVLADLAIFGIARTSLDLSLSNHGPKTVSSQYTSSPVPLLKDKECFQHISI